MVDMSATPQLSSSSSSDTNRYIDSKEIEDTKEEAKISPMSTSEHEHRHKQSAMGLPFSQDGPEMPLSKILTGKKLFLVFVGMLLSVFLIALDQTILAPAIPVIASDFQALDQIAWIASAYFLTQAALLLLYGQALTVFDRKLTYLFAITIFELGSLLCGVAKTVNMLIAGRAVAGVGAAGIFVSVLSIVSEVTLLEDRPKLFGCFGAVFGLSSVIGPILGGAFTSSNLTWRWCFYINLPLGVITIATVSFILGPTPAPPMLENVALYTERKVSRYTFGKLKLSRTSFFFRLASLDWIGSILMLIIVSLLLLALQWGGVRFAWKSGKIIGLFVGFALTIIVFVAYQWTLASGIMPMRLFRNRTQVGAVLEAFCTMFMLLLGTYYLPIYFQAVRGSTPTQSGISILPFVLGIVFAAGASGALVSKLGRPKPFLFFGPFLTVIGSGLLYTITENTSNAKLTGYQLIASLGVGCVLQNTIIAIQADIADEDDIPQATALVTFGQLVGGTIGIAIASTIFSNKLGSSLAIYAPDAPEIVRNSVTAIRTLPVAQQAGVITAYVKALDVVYILGVPFGILASLSSLFIRNVSVKGKDMMGAAAA